MELCTRKLNVRTPTVIIGQVCIADRSLLVEFKLLQGLFLYICRDVLVEDFREPQVSWREPIKVADFGVWPRELYSFNEITQLVRFKIEPRLEQYRVYLMAVRIPSGLEVIKRQFSNLNSLTAF